MTSRPFNMRGDAAALAEQLRDLERQAPIEWVERLHDAASGVETARDTLAAFVVATKVRKPMLTAEQRKDVEFDMRHMRDIPFGGGE